MRKTLVIIDMQTKFPSAYSPRVASSCTREVRKFVHNKDAIILLQYRGFGNTLKEVSSLARPYANTRVTFKEADNGSAEVYSAIRRHKFPQEHLTFCGVNSGHCVSETIVGLRKLLPFSLFVVIADAVGRFPPNEVDDHNNRLEVLRDLNTLPARVDRVKYLAPELFNRVRTKRKKT